jgi:isoquinoline 1-oxidoreductase beta subunit
MQLTGGSSSTNSEFERLRKVGATARAMLVEAAARRWKVPADGLKTENGFVLNGDKKLSYGKLAAEAAKIAPPAEVKLKDKSAWKIIGKSQKRLDTPEKITGRAQYGMDVQFPGLLVAVVARAPTFGGKVKSFKADGAMKVRGVKKVVQVPSGVAVVADNTWAAMQGREALAVDWEPGKTAGLDSDKLLAEWKELSKKPGQSAVVKGDAAAALAKAAKKLEAVYDVPYLAHSPMEPLNATVKLDRKGAEIWVGTQAQTIDQGAAAEILGLKPEQVKLHTMFLGGGFGRRATRSADFTSEAVHVAKAAGAPVKTVWTARGRHPRRLLPADVRAPHGGWPRRRRQARRMAADHRRPVAGAGAARRHRQRLRRGRLERALPGDDPGAQRDAALPRPGHPGPLVARRRQHPHRVRRRVFPRRDRARRKARPRSSSAARCSRKTSAACA